MTAKKKGPPCVICGEACILPWEKNSDGTWAHDDCLRANLVRPPLPSGEKK